MHSMRRRSVKKGKTRQKNVRAPVHPQKTKPNRRHNRAIPAVLGLVLLVVTTNQLLHDCFPQVCVDSKPGEEAKTEYLSTLEHIGQRHADD